MYIVIYIHTKHSRGVEQNIKVRQKVEEVEIVEIIKKLRKSWLDYVWLYLQGNIKASPHLLVC